MLSCPNVMYKYDNNWYVNLIYIHEILLASNCVPGSNPTRKGHSYFLIITTLCYAAYCKS